MKMLFFYIHSFATCEKEKESVFRVHYISHDLNTKPFLQIAVAGEAFQSLQIIFVPYATDGEKSHRESAK